MEVPLAQAKLNYVIELLQKNSNAIAVAARDVKLRQIVAVENQVSFLSFHVTLVQKALCFIGQKIVFQKPYKLLLLTYFLPQSCFSKNSAERILLSS